MTNYTFLKRKRRKKKLVTQFYSVYWTNMATSRNYQHLMSASDLSSIILKGKKFHIHYKLRYIYSISRALVTFKSGSDWYELSTGWVLAYQYENSLSLISLCIPHTMCLRFIIKTISYFSICIEQHFYVQIQFYMCRQTQTGNTAVFCSQFKRKNIPKILSKQLKMTQLKQMFNL